MGFELLFYFAFFDNRDNKLTAEDKRRRDRRTPRIVITRYYRESSFYYLFKSGNNQSLLNCCAVDHTAFRNLLEIFQPVYDKHTIDEATNRIRKRSFTRAGVPKGRKRHIKATGCLGLWFQTRGSVARATAIAFGLTATPMYRWLKIQKSDPFVCSPQASFGNGKGSNKRGVERVL